MYFLSSHPNDLRFPPVHFASREGLLAIGGDLRRERLLAAYRNGIFPWYNKGQPILWWSPDPRAVLEPAKLKISRSLRKTLRKNAFVTRFDTDFRGVIENCAAPRRNNPDVGTWITPEMIEAYCDLHAHGYAHSVETRLDGELVGGLYGVALGSMFFGESMFSSVTDASKVAFVHAVRQLQRWGFTLIDCQLSSAHLMSFGAEDMPRRDFLTHVQVATSAPTRFGPWHFDPDFAP